MKFLFFILFSLFSYAALGQSFEVMTGHQRIFIDAQYLKFFENKNRFSLFSRARATAEYDENKTDLFTGAYLNYTTKSGFGGTVLGRISTNSAGIDAGIHYFKASQKWVIYALPSININRELLYSWFSIVRFTPDLNEKWKLYTSLELFSAFSAIGHLSSVQRFRIGLDRKGNQFGFAINGNESRFTYADINLGVFLRKEFK
ncbi:hypothetical protein [Flammeovirga sp. EKP202]|uniref:hypothetical protein n=1 Tax=Flammeovirga sp. EKP202 TaxID=2770592 RepID=UPI00165F2CDE|nr:hypothetical protein [Flammeovirga sp. EKP202]MBD0404434.1 hypothetical protein [Flammeovirga sp. EKP202]